MKDKENIDISGLLDFVAAAPESASEFTKYIQPRVQSDMKNYAVLGSSGQIPGIQGSEYDTNAFYSKFGGLKPGKTSAFIPVNDNWKVGGWFNPNDEAAGIPQRSIGIQFKGKF